jgi:hypothetical protein
MRGDDVREEFIGEEKLGKHPRGLGRKPTVTAGTLLLLEIHQNFYGLDRGDIQNGSGSVVDLIQENVTIGAFIEG